MGTDAGRDQALFMIVVSQFREAALMMLGKAPHPASGKTEQNLEAARFQIDILGMLEEKTRGNLSEVESAALQSTLTELRLLFVEERDKGDAGTDAEPEPEADGAESGSGDEDRADAHGATPGATATGDGAPTKAREGEGGGNSR